MFVLCLHRVFSVQEACFENISNFISSFCGCKSDNRQERGDGDDDSSHDDKQGLGVLLVPGPDYFRGPSFYESG